MDTTQASCGYEKVERVVALAEVLPALAELEARGFFGMTLTWGGDTVELVAWQKHDEPCYDSGRSVSYEGPCLAVGDDDNHFIAGTMRMCEKTAQVYGSVAYRELLRVSDPDPLLFGRLKTDPVPFDCDTLARDAETIAQRVHRQPEPAQQPVVYLGPFRYIVLPSGAILRRGIPAAVAGTQVELLVGEGYAVATNLSAPPASNFLDLYDRYGPLFLAGQGGGRSSIRMPDFSALDRVSPSVGQRLEKMLDRKDDYFMLQGTDPSEGGCCPLPQVGESNRLVEAGILHSWANPMSPECPVTAYAMAGELGELRDGMPTFYKNELLRRTVRSRLGSFVARGG